MVDMRFAAEKVHRSLLQRDLIAGVPQTGLIGLFVFSIFFIYVLKLYFMIVPIAVSYFIMRHLTAKDPWLIDIAIDDIQQKDLYRP